MKRIITILILLTSLTLQAATIYIDPTSRCKCRDGSIDMPWWSWTEIEIKAGNTYLQKGGTAYYEFVPITINQPNVTIGSYGEGKAVFHYSGTSDAIRITASNVTVRDFDITGNNTAWSIIRIQGTSGSNLQNVLINNCRLSSAKNGTQGGFGIHCFYASGLKIINTEVFDVGTDGMYLHTVPNLEIGYCNLHTINTTGGSGDGIQLDGLWSNFWIHHTTIDRSDAQTSNKFNLILQSAKLPDINNNSTGIVEYCTFKSNTKISAILYIQRGNGVIIRNNKFYGSDAGATGAQAIYMVGGKVFNYLITHNVFYNLSQGIYITSNEDGNPQNTKVWNNTFYNVASSHVKVRYSFVDLKNNIHANGLALQNNTGGSWTIANNCYGTAAVAGAPGTGSNAVIGDPMFDNAGQGVFTLKVNSPCRGAASDGGNIGAF